MQAVWLSLAVVSINYIIFKRFDHDQEPSNLNKLSNEFCFINLVFDIRCRWKDYIIHSKTDGLAWCVVSSSCVDNDFVHEPSKLWQTVSVTGF